jgi:hypothetical protein
MNTPDDIAISIRNLAFDYHLALDVRVASLVEIMRKPH